MAAAAKPDAALRRNHPGYYGVVMGISLPWYCGLGLTFLLQSSALRALPSYSLVFRYVPGVAWGCLYLTLGIALATAATSNRVGHRYVRVLVLCGWLLTLFFLLTFALYDLFNGVPTATLLPAFAAMALVEYRALLEPPVNPASRRR